VLPRAVLRGLGEALRGDGAGVLRGAAIITGLAVTTAGYALGAAATRPRSARAAGASR
jgi:hypothetical protein